MQDLTLCGLFLSITMILGTFVRSESNESRKIYFDMYGAVKSGDLELVEKLFSKGVDPNWNKTPFNVQPMLHKAIDCRFLDANKIAVMKMLLEAGANPNGLSRRGDRALILLELCGNTVETLTIADLLLSYKSGEIK